MIIGLGNPGKGIPPSQSSASASGGANQETQVVSLESSESAVKGSGLPAGGITGLVLVSIVVSLAIAALVAKRRRRNSSRLFCSLLRCIQALRFHNKITNKKFDRQLKKGPPN